MAESSGSKASLTPTLEDVKKCLEDVKITIMDELICTINSILERKMAQKHKIDNPSTSSESTSMWKSFIQSGGTFLSFLNQQKEKFGETVYLFESGGQVLGVLSYILEEVGQIHWAEAGLSMIGYLLTEMDPMPDNGDECLQLLQYMVDLAAHMNKLRRLVPQGKGKIKNAFVITVKGSMLCAKQLHSKKLFRFVKSSVDSKNLSIIRSEINALYPDLQLTAQIAALEGQPERRPMRKLDCPAYAVGIKERRRKVEDLLNMNTEDKSFRAVVIYGFGGIGKTHLARAVYSKLNLKGYNHTRVVMNINPQKNEIKEMQKQILMDALPNYNSGREKKLRDSEEGRYILKRALQKANKPVFLFIDNVQRAQGLEDLLPEGLESVGKHIRLLLTTRDLSSTNMFNKRFRHEYLVETLQNDDAELILCKETKNIDRIEVDRILNICNGVPLVLKIVGAHLENQQYKADKCSQILNALQKGEVIKEKCLSERMVDFVFRGLEISTQEAFLDICCFFNGYSRKLVEYAVGSMELKGLEGAALITCKPEAEYYAPMQKNEEIVAVHDVIKARGQNMARSTRIRDIKSFEAAVNEKRLRRIKGIYLSCDKDSSYVIEKEDLDLMSKSLRVLRLGEKISVSDTSEMEFPELRYVSLNHNIPFVPFNSEALETLAVYCGPLLKEGVTIYELPQSLRKISITKSEVICNQKQSKPIQIAPHSSLEDLYVNSLSMEMLSMAVQSFTALKTLKIYDWHEMNKLGREICQLHCLTTLILKECSLKCLPPMPKTLTHLALENCYKLRECERLVELKALRFLNLEGCTSLEQLPSTFGELKALRYLNLAGCTSLKNPEKQNSA